MISITICLLSEIDWLIDWLTEWLSHTPMATVVVCLRDVICVKENVKLQQQMKREQEYNAEKPYGSIPIDGNKTGLLI